MPQSAEDIQARNTFALFYGIPLLAGIMFLVLGLQQLKLGLATVGACLIFFSVVGAISLFIKRKRANTLANVFTAVGILPGAVVGFVFALARSEELGPSWSVQGLAVGALAGAGVSRPFGWLIGFCADVLWPRERPVAADSSTSRSE